MLYRLQGTGYHEPNSPNLAMGEANLCVDQWAIQGHPYPSPSPPHMMPALLMIQAHQQQERFHPPNRSRMTYPQHPPRQPRSLPLSPHSPHPTSSLLPRRRPSPPLGRSQQSQLPLCQPPPSPALPPPPANAPFLPRAHSARAVWPSAARRKFVSKSCHLPVR